MHVCKPGVADATLSSDLDQVVLAQAVEDRCDGLEPHATGCGELRTRALRRGVQTAEQVLLDESRAEASGLQRLGRAGDETPRGGAGGGAQRGR